MCVAEIRGDAYLLCRSHRRPVWINQEDIGSWCTRGRLSTTSVVYTRCEWHTRGIRERPSPPRSTWAGPPWRKDRGAFAQKQHFGHLPAPSRVCEKPSNPTTSRQRKQLASHANSYEQLAYMQHHKYNFDICSPITEATLKKAYQDHQLALPNSQL